MGDTNIEWTRGDDGSPGKTWNPITGCERVSPGCAHCYAKEIHDKRHKAYLAGKKVAPQYAQPFEVVQLKPERLTWPLSWREPRKIFVNSVSDLFHDDVPDEFIARIWQVMGARPDHVFQLLTKRPARMLDWTRRWYAGEIDEPLLIADVRGYPGYRVTSRGSVLGKRSDTTDGLSPDVGEQGHQRVTMHRESSPRSGERELVHRLVLSAFVRPPRAGEQACHRNGDPSDNRLSNLYWGTQSDNWKDRLRHGNGRSYAKLNESDVSAIRSRAGRGEPAASIAQDFGVTDTQIRNIVSGKHWVTPHAEAQVAPPARTVLSHCWVGVSVENQRWANERIPLLLQTPAAVRFLSCEPLLGPIDFDEAGSLGPEVGDPCAFSALRGTDACDPPIPGIDLCIIGGESGKDARPFDLAWARSILAQCRATGVPVFVKQLGRSPVQRTNGITWWPEYDLRDRHGADMAEWPEDLRVREWPEVRA